jgi:catechol 2,3-dioxygenase-like lactoylglutathione lyase family enzyme
VITGLAHTAVCVPDVEAAVAWYRDVLGLTVLWPPYLMTGPAIEDDMGELVPPPVAIKAAIIGVPGSGDRVLEVLEYPNAPGRPKPEDASIVDHGFTHVGLLCDDLDATRRDFESRGVTFLTAGIAEIVGLRTTWFVDPFGLVFLLMEKRDDDKPYYGQF